MIKDLSIPVFTGIIGYVTNWTGIWMLFNPLEFKGVRIPGLSYLAKLLPRKVQQIPGVMHGGVGWQGIIPSRAAKMGSISVDKTIAKIGSASDFYDALDPDALAEHILQSSRTDIRELVDQSMREEQPQLWRDLPPQAREAIHQRVQDQLPEIVHEVVVDRIGNNIDQLLDVKLMVIRHIEARPELANRMFREVGERELKFIINFGFFFGFACGIPVIFIVHALPHWWMLPILGTIIGWVTNWLAISMIFEPNEPRHVFGKRWQGLFLKRRDHAAEVYASVVADEIVTVANIGEELMHGPSADRTRSVVESALRPAVDRAAGQLQPLVRVAVGTREYDAIKDSVATGGVDYTLTPLQDDAFNRQQAKKLRSLMIERMKELSNSDFAEMLRSGMREDEWLLILHGGVLGFGAGLIHLGIFGV
ncbi:MAG: hypothetical protein QOI80_2531 [Solirubrobacteraceae bacterium]|nr:hypothetical protein [Solirubrobacteraceae bacterium]